MRCNRTITLKDTWAKPAEKLERAEKKPERPAGPVKSRAEVRAELFAQHPGIKAAFEKYTARGVSDAIAAALADPGCIMVNRNAGSGTRMLIDRLLDGARPPGYGNQPR